MKRRVGEITLADGHVHQCVFSNDGLLVGHDPPWRKNEQGLYEPIPGVEHKRVLIRVDASGERVIIGPYPQAVS